MAEFAYLARAVVYGFATLLYAYVGLVIMRRKTSAEAKTANTLFALFWYGLAATWGIVMLFFVALMMGAYIEWVGLLGLEAILVSIFVAIWGLIYYLVFLYTGKREWLVPLTISYALFTAFYVALIAWRNPVGLEPTTFGFEFTYLRTPPTWVTVGASVMLSGPVVAAAIAYGSLYWQTNERPQRIRIALVAGSFSLWFGWSVIQSVFGLNARFGDSLGFVLVTQAIPLVVPVLVLAAYRPPAWLRARIGLSAPDAIS